MLVRPFAFVSDTWAAMMAGLRSENKLPFIIEACAFGLIALAILLVLILPEPRRKLFVALKRKPQQIPLVVFGLAFVVYSFNLTAISNTTNYIQATNMGLTGFVTMLCSVLLLMCCMNAFPYRKKVNVFMLVLTCVMVAILLYCDYYYYSSINARVLQARTAAAAATGADYAGLAGTVADAPEALVRAATAEDLGNFSAIVNDSHILTTDTVLTARNVVKLHAWIIAIGMLLVITLPVYSKLIRKIRTSIAVEGNEQMGAIDISGE